MEQAGVSLIAAGAAAYFSDLKSATKATDSFVDGTVKGSGKVDAAAGGMSKAFSLVGPAIVTGAALAVAAVAGIATAAFSVASDVHQAANDMEGALGVTAEEAARLGDMALEVWGGNWGSSIKDVSDSIITVRQQMKGLADNELQGVATKALAVRDSFGVDIAESTNAANTLMKNFGITSDQAFDFITKGMQSGLNASGDFLDTIGEYSTQFSNGGADAGMFFSLLDSGLQGGMLGTDRAADAFKEFRVRIQDGSKTTSEGLKALGIDSDILAAQMASGQVTAADAFQLVQDKLRGTTDANVRMQAGVALLGTQFEDLGTDAALALSMTGTGLADMAGATDKLNKKYDNWPSMWEGIKRSALVAIEPLGEKLLDLANDVMPLVELGFDWLKNDLPPIIKSVTAALDAGVNFITDLFQNDLTPALESNAAFFNSSFTSIKNIVVDVSSIVQIALGALAGFISDHGETISRILGNTWASIKSVIDIALALIEGVVKVTLAAINGDWQGVWTAITDMSARIVTDLWTIISGGLDNILSLFQDLTGNVQQSWDVMIDDALTAGSELVGGIKEGVMDAWGGFKSWIIDLATGLIDEFLKAWGIKSPATEWMPAGTHAVEGIMQGFSDMWPALTDLVSSLSDDLIDQVGDIGASIQGAIADSFGATASIDRQLAKNLDSFKDVLPQYRQYTEGALKEAESQARAFLDPAEGAKFFKTRSAQILEYAKLQKDLSEAKYQEDKDRIKAQMLLINQAQQAELNQLNAIPRNNPLQELVDQISKLFNNPKIADLEEQYAKAKTDAEREKIKKQLDELRIPVNDTGVGHDLMAFLTRLEQMLGIVPHLAGGGIAKAGQPHWVGEHGPELFWPGITGMVSPAASSAQIAGRANNNQSYDYSRHSPMTVYTNMTPAAIQQSWAIQQASMP